MGAHALVSQVVCDVGISGGAPLLDPGRLRHAVSQIDDLPAALLLGPLTGIKVLVQDNGCASCQT